MGDSLKYKKWSKKGGNVLHKSNQYISLQLDLATIRICVRLVQGNPVKAGAVPAAVIVLSAIRRKSFVTTCVTVDEFNGKAKQNG